MFVSWSKVQGFDTGVKVDRLQGPIFPEWTDGIDQRTMDHISSRGYKTVGVSLRDHSA